MDVVHDVGMVGDRCPGVRGVSERRVIAVRGRLGEGVVPDRRARVGERGVVRVAGVGVGGTSPGVTARLARVDAHEDAARALRRPRSVA